MSSSSASARRRSRALAAEMAVEKLTMLGAGPAASMSSSSESARFHRRAFLHASMAAL